MNHNTLYITHLLNGNTIVLSELQFTRFSINAMKIVLGMTGQK